MQEWTKFILIPQKSVLRNYFIGKWNTPNLLHCENFLEK